MDVHTTCIWGKVVCGIHSFICVSPLVPPLTCATWLFHICNDEGQCDIWRTHICDMSRSYAHWHGTTHSWLIHDSFVTHSWLIRDSIISVVIWCNAFWCIHICDVIHSCASFLQNIVSFTGLFCKRDLFDMTEWMLQGYVSISHVTEINESRHTHEWVMTIISQIWMSCASMMRDILVMMYMYIHIDIWLYHN